MPHTIRDQIVTLLTTYPDNEMSVNDILDNIPTRSTRGTVSKALSDLTLAGKIVKGSERGWYACVLPAGWPYNRK